MNVSFIEALSYQPEEKLKILNTLKEKEDMSDDDRERERFSLLQKSVNWACQHSEFYKKHFSRFSDKEILIQSYEDLQKLPFTTKTDLEENYPFGMLAGSKKDVIRYNENIDTTKKTVSCLISRESWFENNIYMAVRLSHLFDKDDLAIISVNYELSALAQEMERMFELVGMPIISCGIQNGNCSWERLMEIIRSAKASVLVTSYTRALVLADSITKAGYDIRKQYSLKKIIIIGEMLSEAKSKKLEALYGTKVYGVSTLLETGTIATSFDDSRQYTIEDRFYYEVIDTKTLQPVKPQEKGELVITTLRNPSMPLIRYQTGWIISMEEAVTNIMQHFSKRIYFYGKLENMVKLGTDSILYSEVEEALLSSIDTGFLYQISQRKEYIEIYVDNDEGIDLSFMTKKVEKKLPAFMQGKIKISFFDEKYRNDYMKNLEQSIIPTDYVFAHK